MSNYIMHNGELYHHGIKGMKWGRRRYQNPDGSLTPAGIKRYATKGYARDHHYNNTTRLGRFYDGLSGRHNVNAKATYKQASPEANRERAERYVRDRNDDIRDIPATAASIIYKVGSAYAADQVFFKGTGTKIAKSIIKTAGRATITAFTMARGGYDIKWYDKAGNRVG